MTDLLYPDLQSDLRRAVPGNVQHTVIDPFSAWPDRLRNVSDTVPLAMTLLASGLAPPALQAGRRSGDVVILGGYASEPVEGRIVFDPGPAAAEAAVFVRSVIDRSDELSAACLFTMETGPTERRMRTEFVSEFSRLSDNLPQFHEERWFTDVGTEVVRRAVRDAGNGNCLLVFFLGERTSAALDAIDGRDIPVVVGGDLTARPGIEYAGWFRRPFARALAAWLEGRETGVFPAEFQSRTPERQL